MCSCSDLGLCSHTNCTPCWILQCNACCNWVSSQNLHFRVKFLLITQLLFLHFTVVCDALGQEIPLYFKLEPSSTSLNPIKKWFTKCYICCKKLYWTFFCPGGLLVFVLQDLIISIFFQRCSGKMVGIMYFGEIDMNWQSWKAPHSHTYYSHESWQ